MTDTRTLTLVEFLEARLEFDEDVADHYVETGDDLLRVIGEKMRREVEAKRRIVAEHSVTEELVSESGEPYSITYCDLCPDGECLTLRALASVYADHPSYDEAWRS